MISFTSPFSVVIPDSKVFFWIAASVADAAAVNPIGIKTVLANGLSTFSVKGKPVFSNGPKSLPISPWLSYFLQLNFL